MNGKFNYLESVVSSQAGEMRRMGVIIERGIHTSALQMIRSAIPTYSIESLGDLRLPLQHQELGAVIALDIRELSIMDTKLLAECLGESREAQGFIYIMTGLQCSCCIDEGVAFDFVHR
jgi:hypothetical protein